MGEQGWCSGCASHAGLPPMWPGFDSRTRRQMWVGFVVHYHPYSERFFSGYSGFPLSSKTNISKFQHFQGRTLIGVSLCCVFLTIVRCKIRTVIIRKKGNDCCNPFDSHLIEVMIAIHVLSPFWTHTGKEGSLCFWFWLHFQFYCQCEPALIKPLHR